MPAVSKHTPTCKAQCTDETVFITKSCDAFFILDPEKGSQQLRTWWLILFSFLIIIIFFLFLFRKLLSTHSELVSVFIQFSFAPARLFRIENNVVGWRFFRDSQKCTNRSVRLQSGKDWEQRFGWSSHEKWRLRPSCRQPWWCHQGQSEKHTRKHLARHPRAVTRQTAAADPTHRRSARHFSQSFTVCCTWNTRLNWKKKKKD